MSSAMRLCDVLWRRMSMSAASLVPRCGRRGRSPPRAGPWLGAGADPKVVQRILGHASAAMTMDLYGHLIDHNLWAAAEKIGGTTGAPKPIPGGNDEAPGEVLGL